MCRCRRIWGFSNTLWNQATYVIPESVDILKGASHKFHVRWKNYSRSRGQLCHTEQKQLCSGLLCLADCNGTEWGDTVFVSPSLIQPFWTFSRKKNSWMKMLISLKYWKEKRYTYPELAEVYKVVSSVSCTQVWSNYSVVSD